MRLKVRSLREVVNRDLPIEFGQEYLASHGGLEFLRPYFFVQLISVLSHDLISSFHLRSTLSSPRTRSRKRTHSFVLRAMKMIHFLIININRAARCAQIDGGRSDSLRTLPSRSFVTGCQAV